MENDGCWFEHVWNHLSTRTCNFAMTAQCAATFHRFQKPCLGRNWALRLRSAIHRTRLKIAIPTQSNLKLTVSTISLRTSGTDHWQQVDFPLANQGISIAMVMKGSSSSSKRGMEPSMSEDLRLERSNKIWGKQSRNVSARKYDCRQWKGPPKQDSRSCHQICSNSMSPWVRQLENKKLKNTIDEVWRWNEVSWYKPRSGAFSSTYQRPWLHKHLPRRCSLKAVKGRFISLLGAAQPTQMFHSKRASVA